MSDQNLNQELLTGSLDTYPYKCNAFEALETSNDGSRASRLIHVRADMEVMQLFSDSDILKDRIVN